MLVTVEPMKGPQAPSRLYWRFAFWFGGADVLLLLALYGLSAIKRFESVSVFGAIWMLGEYMTRFWNLIHLPTRFLMGPVFFPTITSHPMSPSVFFLFLYQALCILQVALIGLLVGIAVEQSSKKIKGFTH